MRAVIKQMSDIEPFEQLHAGRRKNIVWAMAQNDGEVLQDCEVGPKEELLENHR